MTAAAKSKPADPKGVPKISPAPRPVFKMPGHLLRRCHQIAVGIFLDECRTFDLTPLQFVALSTLAEKGPLDQAALGRAAAFDRTTSATVIRALELRGLVDRSRSQRDRRSKIVTLKKEGQALLDAARASVEAAQSRIVAPLNASEQEQLAGLLEKVAEGNNDFSRAPRYEF